MKTLITIFATLTLCMVANAQNREDLKNGSNTIRLLGGSAQAAASFGLDYERRTGTFGLGAKVLHSTKNEDAGKAESTTVDVHAVTHLFDHNDMDIYLAGGVGVTNMDDVTDIAGNQGDETLVGPTLGIGVAYTINPQWSVGFEYYTLYNWFSDKVADNYNYSNVAVGFNF
ncbi:porin family protein [Bdellovibrio sp. SKB1291214]|uniref:outer membrane beta-barrel protein n=1 Tax=Bdellovibrio sp. SKB1291214 TaxID=1732569 RepID=UPI000B518D63|nr:outer membrane beta-barrel protein [Bdellovibrio sp. SKB1291214]UYL09924.1 porin family protein [Bdellovibrio sp. SKB1291214]